MKVATDEAFPPGLCREPSGPVEHTSSMRSTARRPTLIGSPMRTPLASPSICPSIRPRNDVTPFTLDSDETAALQAAIEASLGDDMKRRLQSSLQSTEQELYGAYSEEVNADRDLKRARLRSSSDLEAAVSEAHASSSPKASPKASPKCSRQGSQQASPALGPLPEPRSEVDFEMVETSEPLVPTVLVEKVHEETPVLPPTAEAGASRPTYEFEGLLDHELLLESLYASSGIDLRAQQDKATALLAEVGLKAEDLGVKNWDEEGRELVNQCFYLSLARSYLGPYVAAEETNKVALMFKRTVEACVLTAHPEWATDEQRLGENAMAFADFLPVAMGAKDPPNLVASMAVLILDATQGHAEVFLGPTYAKPSPDEPDRDREELEKNLVLLCYTPGHYKALVKDDMAGSKPTWTYIELKGLLEERQVMVIETSDFD
mmetsp:Transcript_18798/g.48204  ORF Transcript_18798/g.48204 Transcript_18798/m.48204 type:complete len:433 (+) Transcript_18798:101-1399(+)